MDKSKKALVCAKLFINLQEFADNLIKEEELSEDQKDAFKVNFTGYILITCKITRISSQIINIWAYHFFSFSGVCQRESSRSKES